MPLHPHILRFCKLFAAAGTIYDRPSFPCSFDPDIPTAIHAVFYYQPFGSAYAAISDLGGLTSKQVVPPIVSPPLVLSEQSRLQYRQQFKHVSDDTLMVCRHGGEGSFNIPLALESVRRAISRWPPSKLQFLFMSTKRFSLESASAPRDDGESGSGSGGGHAASSSSVHFMKGTADMGEKEAFLSACDVMLHARLDGETFGLAIAEMSVRNRPVITFNHNNSREGDAHIKLLGDKGFYYTTSAELDAIVDNFVENGIPPNDYNQYRAFSPENVMRKFDDIFVQPCLAEGEKARPWFDKREYAMHFDIEEKKYNSSVLKSKEITRKRKKRLKHRTSRLGATG